MTNKPEWDPLPVYVVMLRFYSSALPHGCIGAVPISVSFSIEDAEKLVGNDTEFEKWYIAPCWTVGIIGLRQLIEEYRCVIAKNEQ
jgi:hypothetical protein